ncbi:ABC transporter substrate-binding protein [Longispora fulva]|uniref:Peptide/nickel transport system substrate-binding protein n=1 Tax=Longispora fulva TaxID=619741 RepID=A0A8J7GAY7_9ACTN|nr:ABC transporter substrate-binding protein [Longispora fulva]MBG6137043.1 peptide/nickel transport system substrate-binding protein [Longispora fulva]GIG61603.1 ABC transporter substrate-binding protein [Longispora fulva]
MRTRLLAGVVAAALATAACTSPPAGHTSYKLSAVTPEAKGEIASFSWSLYAEPPTLDYAYAFDYAQNMIVSNVCESLMRWTPALTVEPGLASAAANPDPLTWVYTIRPGVKFHDGGTMTATDVAYSLNRHLDPDVGSFWSSEFTNVASITETGPLQVTVKLKQADSQFPLAMANSAGTVAHATTVKAQGKDYGTGSGLGCTGPFTLGPWTKGQSIQLDRFDNYWGARAKAGSVVFKFLTDPAARANAMLAGEVDGGYLVSPESYARLSSSGKGTLYFGKSLTTINLNVVNLKGTLGDVRVRRALMLALDREGFIRTGLQGVGTVTSAAAPRDAWAGLPQPAVDAAYAGMPGSGRDLTQAKQLVKDAGATGKKVVIATSAIGADVSLLATAAQSAGTAIGLDVELKTIAPDAFTALFSDPKAREGLDAFPETYYLSKTDPLAMYKMFRTGDFENYGGYSDPAYDTLLDQAVAEYDPAKRAALSARLQQIATGQLLWIPVAEWPTSVFLNKRITGAPTSICYMYYPWAAQVGASG